jgi:uncharacterized sulfatase
MTRPTPPTLLALLLSLAAACAGDTPRTTPGPARSVAPNIIWIVLDDAGPAIGASGDPQAITPHIDRLAREGARFTRAFTHSAACAPSRSGLIAGMYPTSMGSHHMRSLLANPPQPFMRLLRDAGYYVVWPGKMDFNFYSPGGGIDRNNLREGWRYDCPECWDSQAPWLGGTPPRQPFFAYLDVAVTHESQVRATPEQFAKTTARLTPDQRHDPARMRVPSFFPDIPEVRQDLARFYDLMTAADYQVGDVLAWLDRHGLTEHTVVMVFGDHGIGLPRMKRWVYDSSLQVDLVVRWPGQIAPGTVREDLVAFVDFAPTVLSIAGVPVPERMQGQIILGPARAADRQYVYGARDRFDNAFDRIRSVRDARYHYIRNFQPEIPYAQRIPYAELGPTLQAWRRLAEGGRLTGPPALFFAARKPEEELYDTAVDRDEVRNLAGDAAHREVLVRLREALDEWMASTTDLGAVPEAELVTRGVLRPGVQ